MGNYKVSVIVPVFNASQYISETLDSILSQDFDDFELLVIDDGSIDDSLEIINEKLNGTEIPHKIIHQENSGVSVARNRGIDESSGDYLVFIDADDYVSSNHLSGLYNGESDFSLTLFVKKEGDKLSQPYHYLQDSISAEEFIKKELKMEMPFNFFQLMYKSDIIKGNDITFTPGVVYGEDIEFALKALALGETITINDEVTYFYRQHSSSAIRTSEYRRFKVIGIFENVADFYRKLGRDDLAGLIVTSRIPKAIFGNMNFFFHSGYDFDEVLSQMRQMDLLSKLARFEGDGKFKLKIRLFLLNPKLYYKMWMKFKNTID